MVLGLLAGLLPVWLSWLAPAAASGMPAFRGVLVCSQALLLAAALVVVGVRPAARLLVWPVVVLAAWLVGPALTAVAWLEPLLRPGYGLPRTLPDALAGAWQVFGLAASPVGRQWGPWVAALVAAVFVAVLLDGRRRLLATPPTPPGR